MTHSDHVCMNNSIYYVMNEHMVQMNMETLESKYITGIEGDEWLSNNPVGNMYGLKDAIMLFGWRTGNIAVWDFLENRIEQIFHGEDFGIILSGLSHSDQLFVYCLHNSEIMCIGKKGIIDSYKLPFVCERFLRTLNDGKMWFTSGDNHVLFQFDVEKRSFEQLDVPFDTCDYLTGTVFNDEFIMLYYDKLLRWKREGNIAEVVLNEKNDLCENDGLMIPLKDRIIILPRFSDVILEVTEDGQISIYNDYPSDFRYVLSDYWLKQCDKYTGITQWGGRILFANKTTDYMLEVNLKSGMLDWIGASNPSAKEEIRVAALRNGVVEEKNVKLEDFITSILG